MNKRTMTVKEIACLDFIRIPFMTWYGMIKSHILESVGIFSFYPKQSRVGLGKKQTEWMF